ncbi:hypothetical protein V1508DRAFT_407227 [Lipomyces doorenjongii]|uniref:uncharacterized protein n=1 Tax=Lipomyces doorenjongii TaxID=383834 RepID=UPI0034CE5571
MKHKKDCGKDPYPVILLSLDFTIFDPGRSVLIVSNRRRLKSSDIFIKGLTTESLSDALRATYKVLIESDDPLSSYSYQSSPHFRSAAIDSRTPGQKKLWLFTTVLFMAGQVDNGFRIPALALHFTIICLYIGITMKGSLKEDDAGRATVYFNDTEKNWVTSSDFALFASWERMEIPIKWSGELLFLNGGDRHRKESTSGVFVILGGCIHIATVVLIFNWRRRTVPAIEIQLAQVRKSMTGPGVYYYDFAIAGEYGGLVYGSMLAGGLPANVLS